MSFFYSFFLQCRFFDQHDENLLDVQQSNFTKKNQQLPFCGRRFMSPSSLKSHCDGIITMCMMAKSQLYRSFTFLRQLGKMTALHLIVRTLQSTNNVYHQYHAGLLKCLFTLLLKDTMLQKGGNILAEKPFHINTIIDFANLFAGAMMGNTVERCFRRPVLVFLQQRGDNGIR